MNIAQQFVVVSLNRYINLHFKGNKAAFARSCGVNPTAVTKWINAGWVVGNGSLYSERRLITKKED